MLVLYVLENEKKNNILMCVHMSKAFLQVTSEMYFFAKRIIVFV